MTKTQKKLPKAPATAITANDRAAWAELLRPYPWTWQDLQSLEYAEQFIVARQRVAALQEAIAKHGMLVRGPQGGLIANPAVSAEVTASRTVRQTLFAYNERCKELAPRDLRGERELHLGVPGAKQRAPVTDSHSIVAGDTLLLGARGKPN